MPWNSRKGSRFFSFFVKQFQVLLKASSELLILCRCAPEIFSFANQMFCEIIGICIVISLNKKNNSSVLVRMNAGWAWKREVMGLGRKRKRVLERWVCQWGERGSVSPADVHRAVDARGPACPVKSFMSYHLAHCTISRNLNLWYFKICDVDGLLARKHVTYQYGVYDLKTWIGLEGEKTTSHCI